MDLERYLEPVGPDAREELEACNRLSGAFGLALSQAQARELTLLRAEALRRTGRVEFGGGILKELVTAFCDSPYLTRDNYAETLAELQDAFYELKNESADRLSDEELVGLMKTYFNGVCQGSVEYLAGTTLAELCRAVRNGEGFDPADPLGRIF